MKQNNIKLSESQLADLFKNESIQYTSSSDANDCLGTQAASANRLKHAEEIANDFSAAQGLKASFALKEWSGMIAESIETSRRSWFGFLGMGTPMKTALATASFAFAFAFALPVITQLSTQQTAPVNQQIMAQDDLINQVKFDGPNDRLSRGGFDNVHQEKGSDQLFNANFS